MIVESQLDLHFKGSRDYLHGPDIWNETFKCLKQQHSDITDIDLTFHHLARNQLILSTNQHVIGKTASATCTFVASGMRERAYLIETKQQVTERFPYPEDEIVTPMDINLEKQSGELIGNKPFTDIQVWVAMTKSLHHKVYLNLNGKWLFVRGRFARYTEYSQAMTQRVSIVSCFNNKLTKSEVIIDGCKVGEIYFSIV